MHVNKRRLAQAITGTLALLANNIIYDPHIADHALVSSMQDLGSKKKAGAELFPFAFALAPFLQFAFAVVILWLALAQNMILLIGMVKTQKGVCEFTAATLKQAAHHVELVVA
ncbi:hypothetical protein ACJX0J_024303, partial [Zea mays]